MYIVIKPTAISYYVIQNCTHPWWLSQDWDPDIGQKPKNIYINYTRPLNSRKRGEEWENKHFFFVFQISKLRLGGIRYHNQKVNTSQALFFFKVRPSLYISSLNNDFEVKRQATTHVCRSFGILLPSVSQFFSQSHNLQRTHQPQINPLLSWKKLENIRGCLHWWIFLETVCIDDFKKKVKIVIQSLKNCSPPLPLSWWPNKMLFWNSFYLARILTGSTQITQKKPIFLFTSPADQEEPKKPPLLLNWFSFNSLCSHTGIEIQEDKLLCWIREMNSLLSVSFVVRFAAERPRSNEIVSPFTDVFWNQEGGCESSRIRKSPVS